MDCIAGGFFNKWHLDIERSLPIKVVVDTPVATSRAPC
jgi:hypothetical protein